MQFFLGVENLIVTALAASLCPVALAYFHVFSDYQISKTEFPDLVDSFELSRSCEHKTKSLNIESLSLPFIYFFVLQPY
jgi:hypothetical protein